MPVAKLTKDDALIEIIRDAMGQTATKRGYKRMLRACEALELSAETKTRVLTELAYCRRDGTLYDWLVKKPREVQKPF